MLGQYTVNRQSISSTPHALGSSGRSHRQTRTRRQCRISNRVRLTGYWAVVLVDWSQLSAVLQNSWTKRRVDSPGSTLSARTVSHCQPLSAHSHSLCATLYYSQTLSATLSTLSATLTHSQPLSATLSHCLLLCATRGHTLYSCPCRPNTSARATG